MDTARSTRSIRALSTPRAAAVAGILFAGLFASSLILLRRSIPEDPFAPIDWVARGETRIRIALVCGPLAGIAFLWFIGVVRDQLGDLDDRFFGTVFLGSGVLFLGMVAVSLSLAGAIVVVAQTPAMASYGLIYFARSLMLQVSNVWGVRFAGVFMISLATIWIRTRLMPRWLALVTYLLAGTLLIVVSRNLWITLVFPAWVCGISALILVRKRAVA